MFIVAKAGIPVVTDTSKLGGDAPINPYFVAFLAIVSGLLSENALANVTAQGEKFLGQGAAGPDRWARADLTPELQGQGLSLAALASHLGVTETVAAVMLKGEQKIDPAGQKIIAIYLRKDLRDLFTDIPPPGE
jgi:lambda repressor-like predicted transcriptional regulator